MDTFRFAPAKFVPFRDTEVIERVRKIKREEITRHPNPDYHISVLPDADIEIVWLTDMFYRIKTAADEGRQLVMILPNPWSHYSLLAHMINKFQVDCRKLYIFAMDEYANEDGVIAPDTWRFGLVYAMKNYFYYQIDPALRPPESQVIGFTDKNIHSYSQMIADLGGADMTYTGPGWTGHLAFFEPDAPETQASSLEEWMTYGARIVTLSPFSIAQNSLHGSFGKSGDLSAVPPRAATIGPADVIACKFRINLHAIGVHGTSTSWQRLITRLATHGPVTPQVPDSLHQLLRTDVIISETIAQNIEPDWEKGY
jgi:6-phosphogluconolactonase/glucosamine-6-phosphate isomerase/deaminase